MSATFYIAAAIAIGTSLSVQPPVNAAMARMLNSPLLAALISIAISLVLAVGVWLAGAREVGALAQVRALPVWVVIGGIVGVVFVVGSIIVAPVLGVALFFICIVAGQLLGSMVADHFGAFGLPVKPITTVKLLGLAMVLAGAALVQTSNG